MMSKHIVKPWGYETIFAHTPQYVGKILFVKGGHKLSLQYHEIKDETIYLKSGKVTLELHKEHVINMIEMQPGVSIHVPPNTIHRIIAEEDSEVLEASTPELDDVVRLEDDYGRVD